jgi:orotate phosphoribosyltransferase
MTAAAPPTPAGAGVRPLRGAAGVLRFGEFKTKAGRLSPYFFNAGCSTTAPSWAPGGILCTPPAGQRPRVRHAVRPGLQGHHAGRGGGGRTGPAGAQRALCLQPQGSQGPRRRRHPGRRAGAGRVLVVDDVISAGTSVRESIAMITGRRRHALRRGHRARPPGKGHRRRAGRPYSRGAVRHASSCNWACGDRGCHAGRPAAVSWRQTRRCRPVHAAVQAYRDRYGV